MRIFPCKGNLSFFSNRQGKVFARKHIRMSERYEPIMTEDEFRLSVYRLRTAKELLFLKEADVFITDALNYGTIHDTDLWQTFLENYMDVLHTHHKNLVPQKASDLTPTVSILHRNECLIGIVQSTVMQITARQQK